ncbi:SpoIID/LytB domain-containing protein [Patescibacteria group bacterium]
MPARKHLFLTTLLLLITFITYKQVVFAGCSEIGDLDDRAACYGEKLEDKQDEYESISSKLDKIRSQKNDIQSQIETFLSELNVTQAQIDELQAQINIVKNELEIINRNLQDRRATLAQKIDLRNLTLRNYSKRRFSNELEIFFSLDGFQTSSLDYIFNKTISNEALRLIAILNSEIDSFEKDKAEGLALKTELETTQGNLLSLKADIDSQKLAAESEKSNLEGQEESYEKSLSDLQDDINSLSSKQQAILREKYGDSIVSGYEAASYKLPDPPFKPAFAAMSYGAYTHRNGMSQYGAKGRAEDGQDYEDILEYYYKTDVEEKDDFPDKISVQEYGDLDFQYYLYGIAEMPSSWPMDALKAQAIAARSYAHRAGKPICTSQSCQVFLKSKADDPPDRWKEAVDDTKDMVLDDPSTSQYSSTTGGYLNGTGWDTAGGNWPGDAYEKKAKSPWFYKAWYTKSYYDNSGTCGRSTPWLSEDEMTDILNAWVVWREGSSSEKGHISPTTTDCWGGDPYSRSEMADKADDHGGSYDSISNIDVDISNSGYTSKVKFQTNRGSVSIDGSEFMTVFNLRAPAYVSIRGVVGNRALFDIEHED